MGQTLEGILQFLKEDEEYRKMFKAAFGDPNASSERMLKAMAQFTGSLVSANSKYDQVMNGKDTFSNFEKKGYIHFKTYCGSCHQEPLFSEIVQFTVTSEAESLLSVNGAGGSELAALDALPQLAAREKSCASSQEWQRTWN
jgi:cytochrome c peroxidase